MRRFLLTTKNKQTRTAFYFVKVNLICVGVSRFHYPCSMSLTKQELQRILRKYGLSHDGKRLDLIARLKDHLNTTEEDVEAEARPETERLDRIEEQMNEMRRQQEQGATNQDQILRILGELRHKVIASPPPDLLSSPSPPPSTSNVNNNTSSPMPPEETATMRMRRQKAMTKISSLAQARSLPETDSEEEL